MSKILRLFYRIFIKNKFIRWAWMLGLAIWGFAWASQNMLPLEKTWSSKTLASINPEDITTINIKDGDDETVYTKLDSSWAIVKNNITAKVHTDSMMPLLHLFSKVQSKGIVEEMVVKRGLDIDVKSKNDINHSFSIFYLRGDTIENSIMTYISTPKNKSIHKVEGNWLSIFGKPIDTYRNKTILNFNKKDIVKFELRSLSDTTIFYAKDTNWIVLKPVYIVNQFAFKNYLENLSILRGSNFYNKSLDSKELEGIENQLVINTKTDSIILTAYRLQKGFVLHSSQNEEANFRMDSINLIFPSSKSFLIQRKKR